MNENILFVDDDPNVLAAFERQLRKQFNLKFALGGEQGLQVLAETGSFAVVVADMQMPGMNGIQFLSRVRANWPNTVRMMLTGHADMRTAIDAVNQGNIFRFLTKPCSKENLILALQAGLRQYQLIMAEHELLEKTLRGSLMVMGEILSMVNPGVVNRSTQIWRYTRHIAMKLQLKDLWRYDLAATLSQIGCITLPHETLDRIYAQRSLTEEEEAMFRAHPSIGCKLLINIPRLELVARMIEGQQELYSDFPPLEKSSPDEKIVALGAQILKVAHDFDQMILRGKAPQEAYAQLFSQKGVYNPEVLSALKDYQTERKDSKVKIMKLKDLCVGMVAEEDIRAETGLLLVPKGQEVTYTALVRLRNFAREVGIVEPFRVYADPSYVESEPEEESELTAEEVSVV